MLHSITIPFVHRMAAGCFALLLFAGFAHADGFAVQPSKLSLSAMKPAAFVAVSNSTEHEMTVEFNVTQWSQENGRERLTPSRRLIVHPDRITLQPGDSSKVRVGLKLSGPRWEEEAFQVLVSELPRLPDVGVESSASARQRVVRSASLPVFVRPPGVVNPRVHWRIERNSDGAAVLHASNRGKAHVRLHSASLLGPAGRTIHKRGMSDYLLPGGSRTWVLAHEAPAGVWQLTANTTVGPMKARLHLEPDVSAFDSLTQVR